MSNEKKKEKISKPNFGHTEDEWGTARKFSGKEKKYCECLACKDTIEKRKKNPRKTFFLHRTDYSISNKANS